MTTTSSWSISHRRLSHSLSPSRSDDDDNKMASTGFATSAANRNRKRNVMMRLLLRSSVVSHTMSFLLGAVLTWCLFVSPKVPQLYLGGSTSSCALSFGAYHGHEYRSTKAGTVGSATCLLESKFLKVQQHRVRMPSDSNNIIDDWIWIDYHDRINVLVQATTPPQQQEPSFWVFEQTKYALEGRMSFALVGGIIEPGEQPEQAARREVQEEMKLDCTEYHFLGRYRTDVNRGMGWTNTFLASKCETAKRPPVVLRANQEAEEEEVGIPDTERQDLKQITLSELRDGVQSGNFLEIQWTATVALAILHLQNDETSKHRDVTGNKH